MTDRLLVFEPEHGRDLDVYAAGLADAGLEVRVANSLEVALACAPGCTALAAKAQYITQSLIDAMPGLRWIQALTTGYDPLLTLDLSDDLLITNARGMHGPQMAELAFLSMLALARRFPRMVANQARSHWERWPQPILEGRTIYVFGVGVIGEAIAARARPFGLNVVGVSDGRIEAPLFDRIVRYADVSGVIDEADFVIVVTPYTPATHHLFDATMLAAMRSDAFLINIARGNVVDEAALADALARGTIAGAALDVFSTEPLPAGSPFWTLPNAIVTPHIGGMSDRYAVQVLPILAANARAFITEDASAVVNRVTL